MKKSLPNQVITIVMAGLFLGLSSCQTIGIGTSRKKYSQEISRLKWSPDGEKLLFNYSNYFQPDKTIDNRKVNSFIYYFDFISKKNIEINKNRLCGTYTDQDLKIVYKKANEEIFESNLNGKETRIVTPHTFKCPLFTNQNISIVIDQQTQENKVVLFDRKTGISTEIKPDESVQKFIQAEKIADYEIEHVFERNGVLRLVLLATHQAEGLPTNQRPPVTYATALLQDNQMTQIEKLFYLEKPFGVQMFFWGISPDNKLIFGKAEHLPPLEYFEYDYAKHQRNSRPDLNKINDYHVDGRVLTPEAFSPDFTKLVYLLAHSEDSEKNPIRDLMLIDLSTGKEESLFTINTTLPQGDFTWSY